MSDTNKVWFVTGASKGLGLTLVKRLLKGGHKVAATSRSKSQLIDAVGDFKNFLPLEMNLSDEMNIREAIASTIKQFGSIDVLVNNAGYGQSGAVEEVTDLEARKNYEANVFGLLNVTRAVLPYMRKQRSGHIYNVSSVGGFTGSFSGWGVYCSTKFAVSGLTEALHAEVKDFGIKVTLVYPGYFRTNFLENDSMAVPSNPISEYKSANESISFHKNSINGNQPGDPEKAAKVMMELAEEVDPPLHLFLGKDAFGMAREKIEKLTKEMEQWQRISESTDF